MSDFQTLSYLVLAGGMAIFGAVLGITFRRGAAYRKLPNRR